MKRQKDWRMSSDVGEATKGVEEGGSAHSQTLPSLHLRYSSFSSLSNPSVASPTSQLVLQPFCRFIYVKCTSPMSPGEPPMSQTTLVPNSRYATGRRWVSQWFQSQAADFYDTEYKCWSHGMTNASTPEVNMLKNSSTLAVSVQIIFSLNWFSFL